MKNQLKMFVKAALFVIIGLFLLQRVSWLVQSYGTEKDEQDRRAGLFFTLPRNSVDCLFAGTSQVYCSFIPQQMYDTAGITSASVATSAQSYQSSYWLIKEALKRQKPKVVILGFQPIATSVDDATKEYRLHFTSGLSALPDLSINKIKAYDEAASLHYGWSDNMTVYDVYSLLEYKSEYDRPVFNITEFCNLVINPSSEYRTLGYMPLTNVFPMDTIRAYSRSDNESKELDSTIEFEYLNKIYDLLEENDIQLLLTWTPYYREINDYYLYDQAIAWAAERNIPLMDYFTLFDEADLNLKTDFADSDHLNYLGANKATTFLTEFLQNYYSLSDHRGDDRYSLWEQRNYDYQAVYTTVSGNTIEVLELEE